MFLAAPAARKLQRGYNPCWQTFPEVSELQVNNTHTRAIAQEPLPRALLEMLCRGMKQRSPRLQSGFVCSFPTFLRLIPWLWCVVRVRLTGSVCSQAVQDKGWAPGSWDGKQSSLKSVCLCPRKNTSLSGVIIGCKALCLQMRRDGCGREMRARGASRP